MKYLKIVNYFILIVGIFSIFMTLITKDLMGLFPVLVLLFWFFFLIIGKLER
jgi:hypothetical protein